MRNVAESRRLSIWRLSVLVMVITGAAAVPVLPGRGTGAGIGWKGTLVVTEGAPGVFVIFMSFGISLRKSVLLPRLLAARLAASAKLCSLGCRVFSENL